MSTTIPIQNLIIDTNTDIGLTSDLINGTYKSSSLTDLSNNVYSKITDLSSNVYTQLSNKQNIFTVTTPLIKDTSTNIRIDLSSYLLSSTASSTYATISNLNTKQNNLTFTSPLVNTTNTVTIDLSAYPLKTYVDGSLNTINSTLSNKQNNLTFTTPLIKDVSNNITIDLSAYPLKSYVDGSLNTINTNKQNKFTCITPLIKNDISNNVSIDLSGYLLTSTATSTYATISNLNTKQNIISVTTPLIKNDISNNISIDLSGYATISNLNTKQNTLTFSSPLVNTSNTVTIDLSAYPLKSYVDGSLNTINTNKQNKFTCITPLIKNDISNNVSIDLSGYLLTSTATSTYATISNLNTKQNIFTCVTPLIKNDVSNNISIDLSGYATISNLNTKQNTLTFSSPLVNTSNTVTIDLSAYPLKSYVDGSLNTINTNKQNNLTFSSPLANTSNTITIDLSAYDTRSISESKYLKLSGGTMTGNLSGTTINTTGNVGIGITNPFAPLTIGSPAVTSDGFIVIAKNNLGNRNFKIGYDNVFSMCFGDFGNSTGTNTWNSTDFNIRYFDGNIGMGVAASASYKLNVNGTTYFNGNSTVIGTLTATTFSGSGANLTNLPLSAYSTTGNDASYLLKTGGTLTGTLNGTTINTTTNFTVNSVNINNWLFNSTGTNHQSLSDFNAINKFGYTFINNIGGTLNGPSGTGDTQFYSWFIGLGADYPAIYGTINSYGMQFAIGRTAVNPILSIRRNENNSWTSWQGITAEKAVSLTSGDKTINGILYTTGKLGVGTATANNILQVGDGGKLRISNGIGDYSLIGTKDTDDTTNTRIVISGNTRTSYEGRIEYVATAGDHIFYTTATNERMRILNNGNVGIGTNNPRTLLHIKGTSPALTIMAQGGSGATTQLNLSTYDHTTNAPNCSLIATDNGTYGATFQIKQKTNGADANAQFTSFFIDAAGNVNIGTTGQNYKLYVNGTTYINGATTVNGTCTATTFSGSGASLTSIPYSALTGVPTNYVLKAGDTMTGSLTTSGSIIANSGTSQFTNSVYIFNPFGRTTHFPYLGNNENYIRGKLNIDQDDLYVGGATTISGRTYCNGGLNIAVNSWVYDTNGNQRIFFGGGGRSYYQGYGQYTTDINHEWRNHVGSGVMFLSYTGTLLLEGEIVPLMASVANSGTDYCGVTLNSSQGTNYKTSIKIMFGTFTGFHRCFTDDIEFKEEEPQKFKDDYVGRIVVSTGKIATDTKIENDEEWTIKYDKDGITIEDALPIIQLSRTKKDKRIFGVLGMPTRQNSRNERLIVNSVGEGAIWVCNSNSNIENGDYIQSSDYLGYGEKQDDDLLHNYTVAKATIDCNFELDSPYYNCLEIENGLRIAFIACTYHCG